MSVTSRADPLPEVAFGVLRHLVSGRFVSGEVIAADLDVSRGTVWNAVRALQAVGLQVHRIRGKGYRLAAPFALLDPASIRRFAGAAGHRVDIEVATALESTNSTLLARAREGARDGAVLVCELQTAGRGRRGASWVAPLGGALTFSLLRRFDRPASELGGLSLAIGVACAEALEARGVAGVALKWPNDLLLDGDKLGGILIELHGDMLGPAAVVIGIGLNIHLDAATRGAVPHPIADLAAALGAETDRNETMGALLAALVPALDRFAKDGFAAFRDAWLRRHALADTQVSVSGEAGARIEGRAIDVAADGALILETPSGRRTVHSGEIGPPGLRG